MKALWNDSTAWFLIMNRLNRLPNLNQEEEETEMSNPIFNALGGNMMPGNNILAQFQQFRQQMQGKNPHEEINKLLQSGAISQQELNQAQQMAQQFQSIFRQ
jgi:hypothetical protein